MQLSGCLVCWCVLLAKDCGCGAGTARVKGWLWSVQDLDLRIAASQAAKSCDPDWVCPWQSAYV